MYTISLVGYWLAPQRIWWLLWWQYADGATFLEDQFNIS
jgi:hypothetical protein